MNIAKLFLIFLIVWTAQMYVADIRKKHTAWSTGLIAAAISLIVAVVTGMFYGVF